MSMYFFMQHGNTWSVYERSGIGDKALMHNLKEWQAIAISTILNSDV